VQPFELVERSGRALTDQDLLGRTWIVDFVFTTCTGPCPMLSRGMQGLQSELVGSDIGLLSVTVDPRLDDVQALAAYAEELRADPQRWLFLTGPEPDIRRLVVDSFKLGVERDDSGNAIPGQQVTHSTRIVVVDSAGRVRGYYDGQNETGRKRALARARFVAREAR
jgi:cytochrome oxidase Cu insertion factor (SCO1/SenC/PrrC family)